MSTLDPKFLGPPLAHRGYHDITKGRPENSRSAIRAAILSGYGIEIDLQLSADNQAMVFHDYDLARLTNASGPIRLRPESELRSIPLSHGDEGIPTLPEVLQIVAGQVPLLIELKDQDGQMGEGIGDLEQATANALKDYDGPIGVMSFNPHSVARMGELMPGTPLGIVTSAYQAKDWPTLKQETRDRLRPVPDYQRTGASFISHEAADLPSEHVARLRAAGATILCWTIRSPEAEAEARKIADNVTFEGYAAPLPGG